MMLKNNTYYWLLSKDSLNDGEVRLIPALYTYEPDEDYGSFEIGG